MCELAMLSSLVLLGFAVRTAQPVTVTRVPSWDFGAVPWACARRKPSRQPSVGARVEFADTTGGQPCQP
jgi:hypothetical protein